MKRKNGFYWVKTFAITWAKEPGKWTVAEYENKKWFIGRSCYTETDFAEIDERKIVRGQ